METIVESGRQRLMPWVYSVLLHAAFLTLLVLSFHWTNSTLPSLGGKSRTAKPVQATVVDQSLIRQQMAILRAQERQKRDAQRKLLQQAAAARTERKQEEQKVAQLKQQQQAAQQALNRKLADLQQQAQAEQDRLTKLKAAAAVEAKKRRSAESARRRAELEREMRVEERALAERKAAMVQAKQARMASLRQQWAARIKQKVESNWNQPATTPDNLSCIVQVEQVPGGTVANVQVLSCNGDEAVRQSIVTAVYRSSPLPPPSDPSIFDRTVKFTFQPNSKSGN